MVLTSQTAWKEAQEQAAVLWEQGCPGLRRAPVSSGCGVSVGCEVSGKFVSYAPDIQAGRNGKTGSTGQMDEQGNCMGRETRSWPPGECAGS